MKTFNLAPLYRSSVGFDRLVDLLHEADRIEPTGNWPAYDIERIAPDTYRITMAVAGFRPEALHVVQQENSLLVSGERNASAGGETMLHRGLTRSSFHRSFELADFVEVIGATLEHGLLRIDLRREVPAQLRPRRIAIASGSSSVVDTKRPVPVADGRGAAA